MEASEPAKVRVLISPWMKIAMAAAVALLVGISVIMQIYTKTITIPAGQHNQILLPDHSSVRLNAQSTLSYKPVVLEVFKEDTVLKERLILRSNTGKNLKLFRRMAKPRYWAPASISIPGIPITRLLAFPVKSG